MAVKFTNNAATTLAAGINSSATSISVTDGSVFPSLSSGEHFYCTFDDTTNVEIVKVTARSSNTLTVVRGQDNTTARAFSSGDKAELRVVAALLEDVKTEVTSTLSVDTFTGDDSTTAFTLSQAPASEDNLIVFIEGVYQNPGDFTLSGTTLTLDTAPLIGRKIVAYHVSGAVSGNNLNHDQFTANGSTAAFTLSIAPIHENNTQVFIDGVYQQKDSYAVSGTTLTLDANPANGAKVEVMTFTQTDVNTIPASFVAGLTEVSAVGADHLLVYDATDNALKKALASDLIETVGATPTFTTANITNTTTGDSLLFTTTEDSSTAAPVITLKRNSSSPADADYLGQLKFKGENDADQEVVYAKITSKIQDASDGSEDGLLEFANIKAGSQTITARLKSDKLQLLNSTGLEVAGLTYPTSDGTNGQALVTDGSGNLSFSTVSGGVTGISSSADATAITIDSSEQVGIGVSTIARGPLHLATSGSNYCQLHMTNGTSGSTSGDGLTLFTNSTDAGLMQRENSYLLFGTNDTERMRIDSSGFIGMGTNAPSSYNSYADNLVVADSAHCGISIVAGNTSQSTLMFADGTGGTAGYRGRVGYDHNTDSMVLHTAAAERMTINSTGQVLINGANASYPNDTATYGGAAANVIIKGPNSATTDNAMFIYGGRLCLNAHPDRYNMRSYIQSDGAGLKVWHTDNSDFIVGVNNTEKFRVQYSDGIIKCQGIYGHAVSGTTRDVYIEDGGQMGYGSSVRAHKTNIADYGDASWLYNLNPKQFNRRKKNMVIETNDDGVDHEVHDGTYSDTEYWDTVEVGFIAEDVEALDSKLCFYDVVTDEDGNESEQLAGIHYKGMVAPMLKLLKEQKTLIDNLTARIETLENN